MTLVTIQKCPRLITLLKHQCSLSTTEAIGCLENRIGEAVTHYGGRNRAISDAFKARHRLYKQFNNSPLAMMRSRK